MNERSSFGRQPWVDRVHGGLEHCIHGVPYREPCRECWARGDADGG